MYNKAQAANLGVPHDHLRCAEKRDGERDDGAEDAGENEHIMNKLGETRPARLLSQQCRGKSAVVNQRPSLVEFTQRAITGANDGVPADSLARLCSVMYVR